MVNAPIIHFFTQLANVSIGIIAPFPGYAATNPSRDTPLIV